MSQRTRELLRGQEYIVGFPKDASVCNKIVMVVPQCSKTGKVSEKSGTNGNFNYFSYFYLQVKVKR
jgi:hypothetical protein